MTLTAKDVAEITRLLDESSFDELHLECDGLKLSLKRHSTTGKNAPAMTPTLADAAAATLPTALVQATVASPAPSTSPLSHEVRAALLGTFYRAPKPGAPAFVEVGARVDEETIVGIIEVMKLMNTVRAGVRGTVKSISAKDGMLVEYGELLLCVEKDVEE